MIRTFISIDLPDTFHKKIIEVQSKFNDFNIKLVDPKNVHITMKFFGDVEENKIQTIIDSLNSIKHKPFDSLITKIGVFPKPTYVKVIWIGAKGDYKELCKNIDTALNHNSNLKNRFYKFNAHATIARVKNISKNKKESFLTLLDELKDVEFGIMKVDKLKLKKSTLTPTGPIYETLHEINL